MLYGPAVAGSTLPAGECRVLPQQPGVGSDIIALVQGIGIGLAYIVCCLHNLSTTFIKTLST